MEVQQGRHRDSEPNRGAKRMTGQRYPPPDRLAVPRGLARNLLAFSCSHSRRSVPDVKSGCADDNGSLARSANTCLDRVPDQSLQAIIVYFQNFLEFLREILSVPWR